MTMQQSDNKGASKVKGNGVAPENQEAFSGDEKRRLWHDLAKIEAQHAKFVTALEELANKRSELVLRIKETQGVGPFQAPGLGLVSIGCRKTKDDEGVVLKTTWFLKRMTGANVTVIE